MIDLLKICNLLSNSGGVSRESESFGVKWLGHQAPFAKVQQVAWRSTGGVCISTHNKLSLF